MKKKLNYLAIAVMLMQFPLVHSQTFYKGADLSYVNEIESCAGEDVYMEDGEVKDIYAILSDNKANVVRYRLWHSPSSGWSDYDDVKNAIARAKAQDLAVILDFHYSDEWADPSTQCTPSAWLDVDSDDDDYAALADSLYNYTYNVLIDLKESGLTPEFVQVGNETNGGMCYPDCTVEWPNPWDKEKLLYNAGISACRAVDSDIKIILHQADPDVTEWWVSELYSYSVTDFDVVGVSFYPCYHDDDIESFQSTIETIISTYDKDVMVVETSAPWSDSYNDNQTNVSNCVPDRYIDEYGDSPSPEISSQWCIDLAEAIYESGGIGLVYWGGEWVSTNINGCPSYGTSGGSTWENQALFDFDNNLLETGPINFMQMDFGNDEEDEQSISVSAIAGDGYVTLSWVTENIDIRNIQIYRDTDSDPSGRTRIATPGADETSYTDSDVDNGTTYYYWVKIVNTDLETINSDAVAATPTSADEASITLTATAGNGSITLYWSTSNIDIRNIQIYRDTDSNPSGRSRIATPGADEISYTDSDVDNGTTYYYWVKIVDTDLVTYNSDAVIATPVSTSTSSFAERNRIETQLSDIDALSDNSMTIYPNPVTNILHIEGQGAISIYNSLGEKVYAHPNSSEILDIDLSGYPRGIYIVTLQNNQYLFRQTIIKE